jgi:hypothetical protein
MMIERNGGGYVSIGSGTNPGVLACMYVLLKVVTEIRLNDRDSGRLADCRCA